MHSVEDVRTVVTDGRHGADLVEVVHCFSRALTGELPPEDLLRELVRVSTDLLDAAGAGVAVPGDGQVLTPASAAGPRTGEVEALQEQRQDGPGPEAFRTGEVVAVPDLAAQRRWPALAERAATAGLHAVAAVPLRARDRTWGVLTLYWTRPGRCGAEELEVARLLADLATSYLVVAHDRDEARRAREALTVQAMTDSLTGLPVRRVFLDRLREAARTCPPGRRLAVLFVDLDGLKYTNDTYGHQAGDDALRAVGRLLRTQLRAGTVAARYGGEEFCVMTTGATAQEAAELGERVRQGIETITGTARALSASIGVASFPADGVDVPSVLAAADAALYRAKEGGRNRVESAAGGSASVPGPEPVRV